MAAAPAVAAAAAQPGDVDPSFGVNGMTTTAFDPAGPVPFVADLVVAPDGRITLGVTAGSSSDRPAFGLARYLPDGRADESFGDHGKVVLQLGHDSDASHAAASYLRSIVLEPDGGVVMVGSADLSVAAARVDAAGRTLWSVVHQLGKPYVSPGGYVSIGSYGVPSQLQPDGKIVIAGLVTTGKGLQRNPLLLRLDGNDGSLDRTFGDGGSVIAPRDPATENCNGDVSYDGLLRQANGTIVVGGAAGCGLRGQFTAPLFRAYTAAGTPIPGFAAGPLGLITIGALRTGPAGTIVAIGKSERIAYGEPAVARFTATGALDTTFAAPNGFVAVPVEAGLAVQADGRSVSATAGGLLRLLADGTTDASFGAAGIAPTGIRFPGAVALQPDGRILVAGQRDDGTSHAEPRFTLVRLLGGTRAGSVRLGATASVRHRAALVAVTCAAVRGAGGCRGVVRLTSIAVRRGQHRVSFGSSTPFALAPGAGATVRVPLNRTARRRLARAPHLRLTMRATAGGHQRRVRVTATRAALR